jgi:hypothetical protein
MSAMVPELRWATDASRVVGKEVAEDEELVK